MSQLEQVARQTRQVPRSVGQGYTRPDCVELVPDRAAGLAGTDYVAQALSTNERALEALVRKGGGWLGWH